MDRTILNAGGLRRQCEKSAPPPARDKFGQPDPLAHGRCGAPAERENTVNELKRAALILLALLPVAACKRPAEQDWTAVLQPIQARYAPDTAFAVGA